MNGINRDRLVQQLIIHEGMRLYPYTDSVGKLTIGVGRNLTDNGVSRTEALILLHNDIDTAVQGLMKAFPWVENLDPVRKAVLVDLCFNLGMSKLSDFTNTLGAFQRGDFEMAAAGLRASKWAKQVGSRATRLIAMTMTGLWPSELSA